FSFELAAPRPSGAAIQSRKIRQFPQGRSLPPPLRPAFVSSCVLSARLDGRCPALPHAAPAALDPSVSPASSTVLYHIGPPACTPCPAGRNTWPANFAPNPFGHSR